MAEFRRFGIVRLSNTTDLVLIDNAEHVIRGVVELVHGVLVHHDIKPPHLVTFFGGVVSILYNVIMYRLGDPFLRETGDEDAHRPRDDEPDGHRGYRERKMFTQLDKQRG